MHTTLRFAQLLLLVAIVSCSNLSEKNTLATIPHFWSTTTGSGCAFKQGTSADTLVIGQVVLNKDHIEHQGLLISGGLIQQIGAPAILQAKYPDASQVECDHAFISPGFINAHEHTSYSFLYPDASMQPIYIHRDEWRDGLNGKPKLLYHYTEDTSVLAWIELRHLMHGVTTIAGSGGVPGIVKNASSPKTSTYVYADDMQTFPYGMNVEKNFGNATCNSDASEMGTPKQSTGATPDIPYVPHVGEGTNCAAKLELDNYLSYVAANPGRSYSLIHGVALTPAHLKKLKDNNVSVIWSPRSNLALYGKTVDPTWLMDAGVSVAIGTDWSLSGSFNILDEMACAKKLSQAEDTRPVTGQELWQMATTSAASALGIDKETGSIATGKSADLVIINDPDGNGLNRLGSLDYSDIIAVFVDGTLMTGDIKRFANPPTHLCQNSIDGKFLCIDFSKYAFSFDQMKAANTDSVDLVDTRKEADCKL